MAMYRVMDVLRDLPISICAVGVGLCTLGNIYRWLGFPYFNLVAVTLGTGIILLMVLRVIFFPQRMREELDNPGVACIYPSFAMLLMLLAQTLERQAHLPGKILWLCAIVINVLLIGVFAYKHLWANFYFYNLLPGWFVGFVGIGVAVVTSEAMAAPILAKGILGYALLAYAILLPLILRRITVKRMGNQCFPSLTILAAPPSLCLVGYLSVTATPHLGLVSFLIFLGQGALVIIYSRVGRFLRLSFTASFASFTFPLAISCLALFRYAALLGASGWLTLSHLLMALAYGELVIASGVVIGIFLKFCHVNWKLLKKCQTC